MVGEEVRHLCSTREATPRSNRIRRHLIRLIPRAAQTPCLSRRISATRAGCSRAAKCPVSGSRIDWASRSRARLALTLWDLRPVVIAVDQGDGGADATVECSGGDHAVHVAKDL